MNLRITWRFRVGILVFLVNATLLWDPIVAGEDYPRITEGEEFAAVPAIIPYLSYTTDYFENIRGGLQRGGAYMGLLDAGLEIDLESLLGIDNTMFVISMFAGQGSDFSANYAGDLGVVSNIYTDTNFNLFNLYIQREIGSGESYFKVGQIAADDEFMGAHTAGLFINSTFGPFNTQSANMGAPIFPLAAPGAVFHYSPSGSWFIQTGVYTGDAGEGGATNRGFDWEFGGRAGAAVFLEGGTVYNDSGGTVKVGGYYHTGDFEKFSTGDTVEGLGAAWVIVDHPVFEAADSGTGVSVFFRASTVSNSDRSVATGYADGGIAISNFCLQDSVLGLAASHTTFGSPYLKANPEMTGSETVLELTYQVRVTENFVIQPDFQYVFDPHVGQNDALIAGVRAVLEF